MKQITFSARDLKAAVARVGKTIGTNSVLSILEDIKFDINKDKATLSGTDLETTIVAEIPCICMEDCVFLLSYKDLGDLLSKVNSGADVIMHRDEERSLVRMIIDKVVDFTFTTEKVDDYPKIPSGNITQNISITDEQFLKTKLATAFCSSDTLRPAMTGVCFHIMGGNLKFVSTDAHRLYVSGPIPVDGAQDDMFVVPCKPIKAMHGMGLTGQLSIELFGANNSYPNMICFKSSNTSIYIRLIDAKYPPYPSIIPDWGDSYNSLPAAQLKDTVDVISLAANKTTNQILFTIKEGVMTLKAEDVDFGRKAHHEVQLTKQTTEDFSFSFNGKLLSEILNQMSGTVKLYNNGERNKAFIIREEENEDLYLLMPLMLNDTAKISG